MSRMGIIVNVDECIGCHACFIACKQENQVSPNIQWNRIRKVENREKNIINYFRASCQHCEDPACLKVCPMKAVYKGPHGEILIDQDKCIACKACLAACPYGMPMFNDQKLTSNSLYSHRLILRPKTPNLEKQNTVRYVLIVWLKAKNRLVWKSVRQKR